MTQERWEELLESMKSNTLSLPDAEELKEALLQAKVEAEKRNGQGTVRLLTLALILIDIVLTTTDSTAPASH